MDAHATSMPVKKSKGKEIEMKNLEADAFKLVKQRIEYDRQCLRVAKTRATHEGAAYHQLLTHGKHAHEVSATAAETFFAANVKIMRSTKPHEVLQSFQQFEEQFSKSYGLDKSSLAPWMALLGCGVFEGWVGLNLPSLFPLRWNVLGFVQVCVCLLNWSAVCNVHLKSWESC